MRTVFATMVARYANKTVAGINRHGMFRERFRQRPPSESIRNAVIKKCTPAQEAAIRKVWSLLMYPACDSNSKRVLMMNSTSKVGGGRMQRNWLTVAAE